MKTQPSSIAITVSRDSPHLYRIKAVSPTTLRIHWVIRYAFYAFVFSIPFDMADLNPGGMATISKLIGYLVVALALLQPSLCLKRPPIPFWYFAVYLTTVAATGLFSIMAGTAEPEYAGSIVRILFSRMQMICLFWIAYNFFQHEEVVKGSLTALSLATALIVLFQFVGLAGEIEAGRDRTTAFDANPNSVAAVLSLGFLAVFGLAYGRENTDWKARLLFWTTSAVLATAIVRTGSRGAAIALALSFGVILFKKGNLGRKLKFCLLGLVVISILAVLSYQIPGVRQRWEAALIEGNIAGRDRIYSAAVDMVLDRPLIGWGPINHMDELGLRLGIPFRDPHNMYLYILTEVGIVGFIPFVVGLWICWRTAWISRFTIQGVTPLMMISFLLMINMKGSWQNRKLFWLMLAYVLASATYTTVRQRWTHSQQRSKAVRL
jgi:O-antigen ligase